MALSLLAPVLQAAGMPTSPRAEQAVATTKPALIEELQAAGFDYGQPIFIRIFKMSAELELWLKQGDHYQLFKTYSVCAFSGDLGPKTQEGDYQAPEGFYYVTPEQLNPWSQYHLALNLGYPNAYEQAQGYTGSALMVHGKCVSIGCFAMTDKNINEIYTLAYGAFENGQKLFRVHSFPFHLTEANLFRYKEHRWYDFWKNLQEGYDYFQQHKLPPNVTVKNKRYHFSAINE